MKEIKCNKCSYFEIVHNEFAKTVSGGTVNCTAKNGCNGKMEVGE